jgi:hypothetical protein
MDGWMGRRVDGQVGGWAGRWIDGSMDQWVNGWMDMWMNRFSWNLLDCLLTRDETTHSLQDDKKKKVCPIQFPQMSQFNSFRGPQASIP